MTPPAPGAGPASYLTVARDATVRTDVERSRFVATVARVADEAEVRTVLEQVRREQYDADHHCHAAVLGVDGALLQASDGGEPSGTAGTPILRQLQGAGLTGVVAVVSRWFGGTLLGTGGLSRAYAAAARAALDEAGTATWVRHDVCEVSVDFTAVGRLEHSLRARGARVLGVDYAGDAALRFAVPPTARGVIEEIVADLTDGTATATLVGQEWVQQPA